MRASQPTYPERRRFDFAQLQTSGEDAPLAPVFARLWSRYREEAEASMTSESAAAR